MIKKGCLYVARAYTDKCNYLTAIRGKSYLESSPIYGIDIEFNMLTAGCLQNPKYVTSLKNVCDWLMPTEKEEREKI